MVLEDVEHDHYLTLKHKKDRITNILVNSLIRNMY